MNRLQKKCFYAAAFVHGLLFLVLIVGPAFFQKPKPQQDLPLIELVQIADTEPAVAAPAQPEPVTPPPQPSPQPPRVQPVQPQPEPAPPRPRPEPPPVTQPVRPEPAPPRPPDPPQRRQVNVDLTQRVQVRPQDTQAEQRRREQAEAQQRRREREQLLREVRDAQNTIQRNLSPSTTIQMPGVTSALFNNYAAQVRREYERRWQKPAEVSRNRVEVEVQVVINRDGRVHSRRVVRRSNLAAMDQSIERLLNAVDRLPPFPPGIQDQQQTFNIVFVLTAL